MDMATINKIILAAKKASEIIKHGGARKGAGRKPKEKTVVMRIPESKVEQVKKIIKSA